MTGISKTAQIAATATIRDGVIIEDHVVVGDNCYLDYGCILRSGVTLGAGSYVGPYCVLGELQVDFHQDRTRQPVHPLMIGKNALIRSHSVLYGGSTIGEGFQTGHHATVREGTEAGKHLRVGTMADIQGHCTIGDYVNIHSNVFIAMYTKIGDYVWIFPHCVFTNDPIPPSEISSGCTVEDYSSVSAGTILLPGIKMGKNSFVGAGGVVTKDIPEGMCALGFPSKVKGDAAQIRDPQTGEPAYPWPYRFGRYMPWQEIGFEAWSETDSNYD